MGEESPTESRGWQSSGLKNPARFAARFAGVARPYLVDVSSEIASVARLFRRAAPQVTQPRPQEPIRRSRSTGQESCPTASFRRAFLAAVAMAYCRSEEHTSELQS